MTFAIALAFSGWGAAFGQTAVDRALWLWDTGSSAQAVRTLQRAVQGEEGQNAAAWYVLGYFEKERFKGASVTDPARAGYREAAFDALIHAQALHPVGETAEQTEAALRYLGETYFQDAMKVVRSFTPGAEADAEALFARVLDIRAVTDPGSVKELEAEWERQLGQAFERLLSAGRATVEDEPALLAGAVGHYEASLALDPSHYTTLYNLAITHYNHGVRQLRRIGPETSMFELMEIQDACIARFEAAMPHMRAAHELQPERLETLKGLMTIHYALSQPEESARYEEMLEQVIRNKW